MKRILTVLLLGLCFAVPVIALAQDTATPDFPTQEVVTNTPDVVTATPSPEPTETPVPPVEPEEPPPTPIDWNLLLPWIGAAILVICIGGFTVLRTALVQLGRSVPLPAWEIGKSTTNTLYEQLMKLFAKTPNQVDDYLGAEGRKQLDEFFKEVDRLRSEVEVLTGQVAQNKQDIAQAAQISNR